jgi:hypothetical protein
MITFSILGFSLIATAILVISFKMHLLPVAQQTFVGEHIQKAKTALESGVTLEVINQLREAEGRNSNGFLRRGIIKILNTIILFILIICSTITRGLICRQV